MCTRTMVVCCRLALQYNCPLFDHNTYIFVYYTNCTQGHTVVLHINTSAECSMLMRDKG